MTRAVVLTLWIALTSAAAFAQPPTQEAVIETTLGTMVIDLDVAAAPNQVAYFTKIAAEGAYDNTTFHRMVKYGIVQGGDPLTKDPAKRAQYGTGGLNMVAAEPRAAKITRGSVAAVLAPGKPDSAGSQFFIAVVDQPARSTISTPFSDTCPTASKSSRRSRRLRSMRRAWQPIASRSAGSSSATRPPSRSSTTRRSSWPPTVPCSTRAQAL
jgi:cyclophilin family peptidyl-prolyl cis-trans isomerase